MKGGRGRSEDEHVHMTDQNSQNKMIDCKRKVDLHGCEAGRSLSAPLCCDCCASRIYSILRHLLASMDFYREWRQESNPWREAHKSDAEEEGANSSPRSSGSLLLLPR